MLDGELFVVGWTLYLCAAWCKLLSFFCPELLDIRVTDKVYIVINSWASAHVLSIFDTMSWYTNS